MNYMRLAGVLTSCSVSLLLQTTETRIFCEREEGPKEFGLVDQVGAVFPRLHARVFILFKK